MNDQSLSETDRILSMVYSGNVNIELWDEEKQEGETLFTDRAGERSNTEDLGKWLERKGYKLVKIDE